ncbi:capsule biosynthesis protein [Photobacterium phosphoreum]|uniref:capsule biosynthesis protein n=1 Tax=Photobacterium phosphoreum TaxID=659 RepID=UPI001E57A325|nr:capsule biosynthesis protein [Photobacterium phosphoreum]MCD9521143.1 capsule biosynthesis protein [Photobacterium phosphoreum]
MKTKIILNKFWKNRNVKQRSFLFIVIIPTLLATVYFSLIASDRYVSTAKFAIKSNESPQLDLLGGISGLPSQSASSDGYILQDFILSYSILAAIKIHINIEPLFNREEADILSRLGDNSTQEKQTQYWRKMVTSSFDPTSGITSLTVRTFNPNDSKVLADAVINASEQLINTLSKRSRHDDLSFAEKEVKLAELRVTKARQAMNLFRQKHQDLDPTQTAVAKMTLIGQLEAQLATAKAELIAKTSFMRNGTSPIKALKRQIDALEIQIVAEKSSISNNNNTLNKLSNLENGLSSVFADYEPLLIERTFAEKAYTSVLASLEVARIESAKKHRYLATFVEPRVPDEALEPYRIKSIFIVFLSTLILWGIGLLGLGAIRDHAGWV